jgi:4-amino-4-deoxy-L-arabinose transferase-like glycosyltransferase
MFTLPRRALFVVGLLSAIRAYTAFHIPLTEDETYYWTWSRRLAFGYVDHPPMVAWLIALTSPFGTNAGFVRLPFILCEALAALALGRTAVLLSGEAQAGAAAAIAFSVIPQSRFAIGAALPDPPYLLCWSLALMFAAEASGKKVTPRGMCMLGLALGGAMLSRFFGWALFGGLIAFTLTPRQRTIWRRGFWIAPLVALAVYAPFLEWNSTHHWVNFTFTIRDRQNFQAFSFRHLDVLSTTRMMMYTAVLWMLGYFVALRSGNALIAWTALPFPTILAFLSFFEVVESYWLLGPFASLCVGIGIQYARSSQALRRSLSLFALPAAYTMLSVLFLTLPEPTQATLHRASHNATRMWSSSVIVYRPLSNDVRSLLDKASAAVMTDRFYIASELAYNGLDPLIVGRSPQVGQWRQLRDPHRVPDRALLITITPLIDDAPLLQVMKGAYASLAAGPLLQYSYAGVPGPKFFTTWCSTPKKDATASLYGRGF